MTKKMLKWFLNNQFKVGNQKSIKVSNKISWVSIKEYWKFKRPGWVRSCKNRLQCHIAGTGVTLEGSGQEIDYFHHSLYTVWALQTSSGTKQTWLNALK